MNCIPDSEELLRSRAREVLRYLRFLHVAVEKNAIVTTSGRNGPLQHRMSSNLTSTLKANLYLLLYSAMEAVFVQLIDEIHEVVGKYAANVDDLQEDLFLQVVRSFKESATDVADSTVEAPIGAAVMTFWTREWARKTRGKDKRKGSISGNVDGLSMHEHLRRYGVVPKAADKPLPHLTHKTLEVTKNRRNKLAHGELAFADLGKGYAIEELTKDARDVFRTLVSIAKEVDDYLRAQGYLKTSSWQGALKRTGNGFA